MSRAAYHLLITSCVAHLYGCNAVRHCERSNRFFILHLIIMLYSVVFCYFGLRKWRVELPEVQACDARKA